MTVDALLFAEIYSIATDILWCTDHCDIDRMMQHVAPDAVFKVGENEAVGADAVRTAVAAATAIQGITRHMLTNLRLGRIDENGVDAHSVILVTLVQPARKAITTLDYDDRFVRGADGILRLCHREMTVVSSFAQ